MQRMTKKRKLKKNPLYGRIAAVSVGIYRGIAVLDLDYDEDSEAETDMNVVMNETGRFVEVQGTAEGHAFSEEEFSTMLGLAKSGIETIIEAQDVALAAAGG
jgi:ribonuclease PH